LRTSDLLAASGYRPTYLDLLREQAKLPRTFRLSEGGRALGWYEDEIIAFQQARIAERDREAKSKRT